jgi:hypothetical protein
MNTQVVEMRPIACFIPCCSSKLASGQVIGSNNALSWKELPTKWHLLEKARSKIKDMAVENTNNIHFAQNSPFTSALCLYTGAFYRQLSLRELTREIQAKRLRLFILSAGYGIVDAFEPLQKYDAEMKGKVARHWKAFSLEEIISELLLTLKPKSVFGFFAGSEVWSDPGAKYRYFFVDGLNRALGEGLDVELNGCFSRSAGLGTTQILGSLGRVFMDLIGSRYSESLVSDIARNSRINGTVAVSFREQSR